MIGVEILHLGKVFPGSREELHEVLAQQNYVFLGTMRKIFFSSSWIILQNWQSLCTDIDDLFVRKDHLERYKVDEEKLKEFNDVYSFNPPKKHQTDKVEL